MADEDVKISVEVDTGRSQGELGKLEDASRDAGGALDALEKKAQGLDATVTVDVELDKAKARAASDALEDIDRKGRGVADGVGFSNSALRDLTGPLGDAVGPAGDLGDAFEGLGDIVGGLAGKFGASADTIGKLTGALAGVGVVVAAGVAAWGLYQKSQQKAREEAEALLEVQELLAQKKYTDAAEKLAEQYRGTIGALEDLGFTSGQFFDELRGGGSILDDLRGRLRSYDEQINAIFEDNGRNSTDPRIVALFDQKDQIGQIITNIEQYQTAWQTSGEDIVTNQRYVDELTVAMGGVVDETAKVEQGIKDIGTAFDDLTRALDDQSAIEGVRDAFDDVEDAAIEAWTAAQESAPDAQRKMRDYEQAVRDAITQVLGLNDELDNVPPETVAEIAVAVQDGDLTEARRLLEEVATELPPVQIQIDTDYLSRQFSDWLRRSGPGSNSMSPTRPPGAGSVPGPDPVRGARGRETIVNYYPPRIDPTGVQRAQSAYRRVNG